MQGLSSLKYPNPNIISKLARENEFIIKAADKNNSNSVRQLPALTCSDTCSSELENEFTGFELNRQLIMQAVDNNDIDTARKLVALIPINTCCSELTNNLIFSYCNKRYKEEDASIRMFELLHEINADFNCFDYLGNTPLLVVVQNNGPVAVLEKLITLGADVNKTAKSRDITPLRMAACDGNVTFVKQLLNAGANAKKNHGL